MVCNHTSCASSTRRSGFSLFELLFAVSIGLMVTTAGILLWTFAARTSASLVNYVDLSSTSKNALDRLSQEIRNAKKIQSLSSNTLVLLVPPRSGTNLATLTINYSPSEHVLRRKLTGVGMVAEQGTLLTGCTNFSFSIYQRTPISNSFDLYPNTNTPKVVQMNWVCARKLTGDKKNIESQVSARIVMRNL